MEIELGNGEVITERRITIKMGDVEYHITQDKFEGIVVNKTQYGEGESSIIIKPHVTNEINII